MNRRTMLLLFVVTSEIMMIINVHVYLLWSSKFLLTHLFYLLRDFLRSSTFVLAFNLHSIILLNFLFFCKVVLYNFIEYHDSNEYKSDSWFDVWWVDHITSEDKKERSSLKCLVVLVSLIQKCTHLLFTHFICCWFCCLWSDRFACRWWSFLHVFRHLDYAHLHKESIIFSSAL